jgi:hypothetical protein
VHPHADTSLIGGLLGWRLGPIVPIRSLGSNRAARPINCFDMARAFLLAVARERAGFTCHASITRDDDPKAYGRHMTVVRGALVVTGGTAEPRLYEVA